MPVVNWPTIRSAIPEVSRIGKVFSAWGKKLKVVTLAATGSKDGSIDEDITGLPACSAQRSVAKRSRRSQDQRVLLRPSASSVPLLVMASAQERSQVLPEMPDWAPWLQAGLTAMLAVLFVVMVGKMRQQSSSIRALQERVQGLENSRALERTSGLEQQLRTTVERLQVVERSNAQLRALSSENKLLNAQLRQLRATGTKPDPVDDLPPLLPPVKP